MKRCGQNKNGFTIVELLIVIVVIAVLAAISVVAYNGVQSRARDNVRKQDLAQLAKATKLYAVDRGNYAQVGCGFTTAMGGAGNEGSGWLPSDYDASGTEVISIDACLLSDGYITKPIRDPTGQGSCSGLGCYAYMKASCSAGTFYYAHLETLPQASTDLDGTCGVAASWDTAYGMNYFVKVN